MTVKPIFVVYEEGGYYHRYEGKPAPIRIYKDRRVQDDILTRRTGQKWRARFSRAEYRHIRKIAA